ncbi:MAG: glycosyltransferase family 2 protein [Bacteroidales bacterium]|nr:glycosyltransferase family 2 protein [Bacteroidales bacterium]
MNDKLPITVLVPTLNASEQLEELILSAKDHFYEIMILDSLSHDNTIDIALKYNLKVVQKPFTYYGDHFQWMVTHMPVQTEWMFLVAQDEVFSDELIKELKSLFNKNLQDNFDAFTVKLRLWFLGKPLSIKQDIIRLVKKGKFKISDTYCNEQVIVKGKVGNLKSHLEHKDSPNLFRWYQKQAYYAILEAKARIEQKKIYSSKPNLFGNKLERRMFFKKIFFRFPFRYQIIYFYNLIYKGAWKSGKVGFAWAHLRSEVYRMWEYAELEMKNTGKIPELPKLSQGSFDPRIINSELQKTIYPVN